MDYLVRARSLCLAGALALVTAWLWPLSLALTALWGIAGVVEGAVAKRFPLASLAVLAVCSWILLEAVDRSRYPAYAEAYSEPVVRTALVALAVLVADVVAYVKVKRGAGRPLPQEPS